MPTLLSTRPFGLYTSMALLVSMLLGCQPSPPAEPFVAPFFSTDYHLPASQHPDSTLTAQIRQGVLELTPPLAAATTWIAADSTVRLFLATQEGTPSYSALAQIATRAFVKHRLFADTTTMTLQKAEVLLYYLNTMYDQGSRDLSLMERGIDSLYVLNNDSVNVAWRDRLDALAPLPQTPTHESHMLPPPQPPGS